MSAREATFAESLARIRVDARSLPETLDLLDELFQREDCPRALKRATIELAGHALDAWSGAGHELDPRVVEAVFAARTHMVRECGDEELLAAMERARALWVEADDDDPAGWLAFLAASAGCPAPAIAAIEVLDCACRVFGPTLAAPLIAWHQARVLALLAQ
ncbi:MAG: hypothetical protein AB7N76_35295 [Planctomycetota bacterium]